MNERLVELYKQATAQAYETVGVGHANTTAFQGIVNGMFAELIVRECADRCEMSPYPHPNYSVAIKKHFGVEE